MEMNIEDANKLGWENICEMPCYTPCPHSHQFTVGAKITKKCSKCNCEMKPDAQVYENILGQNRALLSNAYKCEKCGKEERHDLYAEPPRSYEHIHKVALQNSQAFFNRE